MTSFQRTNKIFYSHFDVKKSRKKKNFLNLSFEYIESFLNHTGVFFTHLVRLGDSKIGINIQRGAIRKCITSLIISHPNLEFWV